MKDARIKRNYSMTKVAELIGISDSAYSRLEKGVNNPSKRTVELFCQKLHISESWLRTGEGEMEEPEAASLVDALAREYNMDAGGVALLRAVARAFEALSPDQRDQILAALFSDLQAAIEGRYAVDPAAHEVPDPHAPADPASSISSVGSAAR